MDNRRTRKIVLVLSVMIFVSILIYLFARVYFKAYISNIPLSLNAIISIGSRSITALLAMVVCSILIAITSQLFQTITNNRVITPSMIGFDSIFIASQAVLVFFSSNNTVLKTIFSNAYYNFAFSTILMMIVSVSMYRIILRKNKNNIYLLLLFGIIVSSVVRSITNYIEILLNPEEFQTLKAATNVTITNMNVRIIYLVIPLMLIIAYKLYQNRHELDVMLLNEDNSKSLGVSYTTRVNYYLLYIALAMSITTALIGPLTFLGLIAVNIAKELTKDYHHSVIFTVSSMIAVLFLVFGQSIVELLRYSTPVTVLINLIGGIYMIYLILKENKI